MLGTGSCVATSKTVHFSRTQVHLGLWALFFINTLVARVAFAPAQDWLDSLARTNLLVLAAFFVVFHLLSERDNAAVVGRVDIVVFAAATVALCLFSLLGVAFDIPLIMGGIGLYYLSPQARHPDDRFLGMVYLALAFNGFVAPLIFYLFKDLFLIGEVQFAVAVIQLTGFDVTASGTRILAESGMRLQMVGACSVFTNLSFAVLGYATCKAFFRAPFDSKDVAFIFVLAASLILANALRLGLMTPSFPAYEFWHHGNGALVFAAVQFAMIAGVSALAIVTKARV